MYSRWQPQPSDPYQINCQPETFPPKSQPLDILSLIRKFEDVCLQANAKSSEQSPIKKPQSLHGRKAQVGTFQDRNTAIVGPTKENRSGFGGVISEGKAISWQRDIRAPFYRSGEGVKLHDAGRVYQTHIPYGACSLPYSVCVSGLKKSIHAPHSTVKDKIRFYEAFAGNEITLSVASPRKSVPYSFPSKRNFADGWHTPNTFLPQTPLSLSSGFQTSPYHTSVVGKGSSKYATTNSDITPVRRCRVQTGMNNIPRQNQTQGKRETRHGVAGRYVTRESGQENCKSIEQIRANGNTFPQHPPTSPRKILQSWRGVQERDIVQPKFSKDNFELIETTAGTFNGTGNSVVGERELSFPTIPFDGTTSINRSPFSMVAPEPGPTNTRPVPNNEENRCMASETHARYGLNNNGIGDKIKLFESGLELTSNKSMNVKNSPPKQSMGPNIGQRKRAFEDTRKGGNVVHGFWQGLSTIEINNIVKELQELQETKIGGGVGMRYTLAAGKWKPPMAHDPTLNRRLVGMMVDGTDDTKNMIVREAECGLKEPKPLRLTETRSILWMCRRQLVTPPLGRRAMSAPLRREP